MLTVNFVFKVSISLDVFEISIFIYIAMCWYEPLNLQAEYTSS